MATVEQITKFINRLKRHIKRLTQLNGELKQQLHETKELSIDRVLELEDDLQEMETKADRLAARNAKLSEELKELKAKEPDENRVAVLHCNEWKMSARTLLESGHMTTEQWRCVLDALLFEAQEGELDEFDAAVEQGFIAVYATTDARLPDEGLA